ncbi:MAG: hypothetical protein K6E59_00160 [Bacilli bacterium]|nr:hypothetical protein [Bacilli bacterium]
MRRLASFFTWVGGNATTVSSLILFANGIDEVKRYCWVSIPEKCDIVIYHHSTPWWLWILVAIGCLSRLFICLWRDISMVRGTKVACGVCALIFCSPLGGILTLCTPKEELGGPLKPLYIFKSPPKPKPQEAVAVAPVPKKESLFRAGDHVRILKDIAYEDGVIPAGSVGQIVTPNSRGEPEVGFEELGVKIRVHDEDLEKAE